jgi:hypothetical protein
MAIAAEKNPFPRANGSYKNAVQNEAELLIFLQDLRAKLADHFASDTAAPGFEINGPSGGQCAAVAVIVNQLLGGQFVSANVGGHSHWFNQIGLGKTKLIEIDLTGDQFGRPPVQVTGKLPLYPGTRVRNLLDLKDETISRAVILAERAGLKSTAAVLRLSLEKMQRFDTT